MTTACIALLTTLLALSTTICTAQGEVPTPDSELPVVQFAAMPLYPELARQAQIEGTVCVRVETDGKSVTKVQATGAHKLLMNAAEENVKTWRFYPHKGRSFVVTFVYALDHDEVSGRANSSVVSQLPTRVEIRAKRTKPQTESSN